MSEQIESISQGNYILHNIDAKKLYVQEPLFTANSGDAVYVGWRPDETVLYSGYSTTTLTLSENPKNFERIKVITRMGGNDDATTANFGAGSVCEFYTDYNFNAACITGMFAGNPTSGAPTVYHYITNWTGTDTTAWTRTYYGFRSVTATGAYSTGGRWYTPFIIIGVNRKENA
jgi:hypothetical protein